MTQATEAVSIDSYLGARLAASAEPELDLAMLRAYAIERAIDYGCSLEDVIKLRRRVEQGSAWVDVALLLAGDDVTRAQAAHAVGAIETAAAFQLQASACLRLAQAALEEQPERRLEIYRQNVAVFASAMVLLGHAGARFDVMHRGAAHAAWLFLPDRQAPPPCVLVTGGADGWCEAFFGSVAAFLERGLAVCLLELPGQGLARLQHGSYLDHGFTGMVSAALDALASRGVARARFGILGHSMGGSLALRAAADDERIRACCTNGGSVDLARGIIKFPRVLRRIGRMMGPDRSDADVLDFIGRLDLRTVASTLRAPVLCMHGGQDPLVSDDEARALLALRGFHPVTYAYWPEGAHCVYTHMVERNSIAADWFARRLLTPSIKE
jgi:alpha-beta hydrolase superfamily lysophospholipase